MFDNIVEWHNSCYDFMQKDSLMEISFHIPNSNTHFVGDENRPSAQVSFFFFTIEKLLNTKNSAFRTPKCLSFALGIVV